MRVSAKFMPQEVLMDFIEWVRNEGLDPDEICDDGMFGWFMDRVSGYKYFRDPETDEILRNRSGKTHKLFFSIPQKNPVPASVESWSKIFYGEDK